MFALALAALALLSPDPHAAATGAPSPTPADGAVHCSSARHLSGGQLVICADRGLTAVPRAPPEPAVGLNLNDNPLGQLGRKAFWHWFSLTELELRNTSLTSVHATALAPLTRLRRLDLSRNHLVLPHALPVDALPPSLLRLNLAYNPLGRIPDAQFHRLGRLEMLRLNGAQLRSVSAAAFLGLAGLRQLLLYNNRLTGLPENYTLRALRAAPRLGSLLLGGDNRWRCDCRLRWLKLWQMENARVNVTITAGPREYGPTCASPPELRGRGLFDVGVPVMAFACPTPAPPVVAAVRPEYGADGAESGWDLSPRFVLYVAIGAAWVAALCTVVGVVCLRLGQASGRTAALEVPSAPPLTSLGSNLPQLQACVIAMEEEELKREKAASDVKEDSIQQENGAATQPSISYV